MIWLHSRPVNVLPDSKSVPDGIHVCPSTVPLERPLDFRATPLQYRVVESVWAVSIRWDPACWLDRELGVGSRRRDSAKMHCLYFFA